MRFAVLAVLATVILLAGQRAADADPAGDRHALKAELARLTGGGAPTVRFSIPGGKSVHPGDSTPSIAPIRQSLAALGFVDPASPADPQLYDDPLAWQVRRFQLEVGLVPDAVIGPETRKMLQIPDADRIRMLQQSLEQRDLPAAGRYIAVNLAAGTVSAMEDGAVVLSSRAVIGKKDTPTPAFSARIDAVWINPAWVVPESIVIKEFGGNAHTEQPGPNNPLGALLLSFPNQYEVFIHSTNEPYLFDRDERDFSHGCIRVQEIEAIGRWVLGEKRWASENIDAAFGRLLTKRVALDQSLPVYIDYRTATVGSTGAVIYHPDGYGLAAPPPEPVADSTTEPASPPAAQPAGLQTAVSRAVAD